METEFKRYDKYVVLKYEDIQKYLNPEYVTLRKGERSYESMICWESMLDTIIELIKEGRAIDWKYPNSYVVVNEDQPYAELVWKLIEYGVKDANKLVEILPKVWTLIKEQWERGDAESNS